MCFHCLCRGKTRVDRPDQLTKTDIGNVDRVGDRVFFDPINISFWWYRVQQQNTSTPLYSTKRE